MDERFTGFEVFGKDVVITLPHHCIVDGAAMVISLEDFYAEIVHNIVSRLKSKLGPCPSLLFPFVWLNFNNDADDTD